MPQVPTELIIVSEWITKLTPIWGVLLIIFWRPLKIAWDSIYNKFVKSTDDIHEKRICAIEETLQELKTLTEVNQLALKELLKHRLLIICKTFLKQGYLKQEELDNLQDYYDAYKLCGGNGVIDKLYSDCIKLPLEKDV